jgi:hypothetical protein
MSLLSCVLEISPAAHAAAPVERISLKIRLPPATRLNEPFGRERSRTAQILWQTKDHQTLRYIAKANAPSTVCTKLSAVR